MKKKLSKRKPGKRGKAGKGKEKRSSFSKTLSKKIEKPKPSRKPKEKPAEKKPKKEPKRAAKPAEKPKEKIEKPAQGEVALRIGSRLEKGTRGRKDKKTDTRQLVNKELHEFEKAQKDSRATPAKIRDQDEHVGLKHIKAEIEKKLQLDTPSTKGLPHTKLKPKQGKPEMVKTGIHGLDEILGGGLPKDSIVLLSGTCGTGKSIFGMNFLIEGAIKGEPGIYIALEESPESNIEQMKLFGWPVDELVKSKKLMILQPELYNFDALLTTIEDSIERIKAQRLVIDAISIIGMYFEDPYKVRKSILQLGALLKKMKCTTIAIDEVEEGEPSLSAYGVEEFVVDGVIVLYLIKRSNIYLRAAVIRKMRGVNHSTKIHPMEIKSPGGIVIYPSQELFEEVS
jgi:KaiC/GvpD/RAD55 family RecA-like ATPase